MKDIAHVPYIIIHSINPPLERQKNLLYFHCLRCQETPNLGLPLAASKLKVKFGVQRQKIGGKRTYMEDALFADSITNYHPLSIKFSQHSLSTSVPNPVICAHEDN